MKKSILFFSAIFLSLNYGCQNSTGSKEDKSQENSTILNSLQKQYVDRGSIEDRDTAGLKMIEKHVLSSKINDNSSVYLRNDNYCWDQFSCVVHGSCYY